MSEFDDDMDDSYKYQQLAELSMIDKIRMKKIYTRLENEDGEDVPVKDVLKQLTGWIMDQLQDKEPNTTVTKVYPLLCQSMAGSLQDIVGDKYNAMLILAQDVTRQAFINEMTLGFYLSRFMEKNGLKIVTEEEDLSQEELDRILRLNKASSISALAHLAGADGKEVIREMLKSGVITREDLNSTGINTDSILTEDEKNDKGN